MLTNRKVHTFLSAVLLLASLRLSDGAAEPPGSKEHRKLVWDELRQNGRLLLEQMRVLAGELAAQKQVLQQLQQSPTPQPQLQQLQPVLADIRQELQLLRSRQQVGVQTLAELQRQVQHVQTEVHALAGQPPCAAAVGSHGYHRVDAQLARSVDGSDNHSDSASQQQLLQRIAGDLDQLPAWQQRVDSKLSKIMNVAAEIYKEDKQLSRTLNRLNELQVGSVGGGLDGGLRKAVQEELSVWRADLRSQYGQIQEQCTNTRAQHENVTFLMLGLKDDLLSRLPGRPNEHLHTLDSDEEPSAAPQPAFALALNASVTGLRGDLQLLRSQLLAGLEKDRRELGEKLFTLSNNYQHLNSLRNCDQGGRSVKVLPTLTSSSTTVKPMATTPPEEKPTAVVRSQVATVVPVQPAPRTEQVRRPLQPQADQARVSARATDSARPEQNNLIPAVPALRKPIRPARPGQNAGRQCKMDTELMAPTSCAELFKEGGATCDGVYIVMNRYKAVRVYCEMQDGGWTVIMRRGRFHENLKQTSFNQKWAAYRQGFGDPNDEFWLGNELLHLLTADTKQTLQVDLEAFDGDRLSIRYQVFRVGDEASDFRLELAEPLNEPAVAGQLLKQNGSAFSTKDHMPNHQLDAQNCPLRYNAGWWFGGQSCHQVLLTGEYNELDQPLFKEGIQWPAWKSKQFLKAVQMKIRPRH